MYLILGSVLTLALHHQHVRYAVHEQQHEAGVDAYLTAQVFLGLVAQTERQRNMTPQHSADRKVTETLPLEDSEGELDDDDEKSGKCEAPIQEFRGETLMVWEGKLSVNGTMEGLVELPPESSI
jgi:DNA polymerase III epsilon subunit-like protein